MRQEFINDSVRRDLRERIDEIRQYGDGYVTVDYKKEAKVLGMGARE